MVHKSATDITQCRTPNARCVHLCTDEYIYIHIYRVLARVYIFIYPLFFAAGNICRTFDGEMMSIECLAKGNASIYIGNDLAKAFL